MKNFFTKFVLFIASTFFVLTSGHAGEVVKALNVELLVFSGRPNPTFVITDPVQIKDILGLAKNLPRNKNIQSSTNEFPAPKLGYQGFAVTNNSGITSEVKSFVVQGANVNMKIIDPSLVAGKTAVAQVLSFDSKLSLEGKLLMHVKNQGIIDEKLQKFIDNSK